MFLKRLAVSEVAQDDKNCTLSQPPVEIPPLVNESCSRGESESAETVEEKAWKKYEKEKNKETEELDEPENDPQALVTDVDEEVDEDSDADDADCNYNEYVYVLTIDNEPCYYFNYKSRALRYMRRRARELCLVPRTGSAFEMTYKVVRHYSEDALDVVRRLNNILISYDQVICAFRIKRVYKKNTL
jgi:hypothetical protein